MDRGISVDICGSADISGTEARDHGGEGSHERLVHRQVGRGLEYIVDRHIEACAELFDQLLRGRAAVVGHDHGLDEDVPLDIRHPPPGGFPGEPDPFLGLGRRAQPNVPGGWPLSW